MAGHDEQRSRVASESRMVSWVRELLRERDEAQARNDEGGHGDRTAAAPSDVVSRIREHRLESEAVRPYVAARVVVGEHGRPALHAHDPAALGPAVTALDAALREEVDAVLVGGATASRSTPSASWCRGVGRTCPPDRSERTRTESSCCTPRLPIRSPRREAWRSRGWRAAS
jgi:hypothetical protein